MQDLFQSESKEWDLTHKTEKRVISEAKDIMWEEENGENAAVEQRGTGADVRFRVAPSGDSADRYTTKEGKKVGFSSRLGK